LDYQEKSEVREDASNNKSSEADFEKRVGEAYKKLHTELAKATDLLAKQDAGQVALTSGTQAYLALIGSLERKGFDDRILLNNCIVVVDNQIEQLRQKLLDAQQEKAEAEKTLKTAKLDEERALALLDAAKTKLVGLPKAIQDRIGEIDTKRQAVSSALEKDDLVGASIALTELKEVLDAGKSQVEPDKNEPLEGEGWDYKVDDIYKKQPKVKYKFPLQAGYPSLAWLIDTSYEHALIEGLNQALVAYLGYASDTADANQDLQSKTENAADYDKRYKDAQTNRLTNIKARYSKALADQAAAEAAEAAAKAGEASTTPAGSTPDPGNTTLSQTTPATPVSTASPRPGTGKKG